MSLLEVLFLLATISFLALLLTPMLLRSREAARATTCRNRLRTLTKALQAYHDVSQRLPAAAVWNPDATSALALHRSDRIDRITQTNWAQSLLPFLNASHLASQVQPGIAIGDPGNAQLRSTPLAAMNCPSDQLNRPGNPYRLEISPADVLEFARGNYAINGGTHNFEFEPPTTHSPHGDAVHLAMSEIPRHYALWGNGIAGINKSFSIREFANGASTLVAVEEIRAGVHPLDPRGVWALGQIGGSLTWGHGVNGDDFGPNNNWERGDDIRGCPQLHELLGARQLAQQRMPCVSYVNRNQQATARSQHPGGAHVGLLDGSVRLISNEVDPGIWHVMHSRETPAEWLRDDFDVLLTSLQLEIDAVPNLASDSPLDLVPLENSLGMRFVVLPAETFILGLPDEGNEEAPPAECPPHSVRLSNPRLMAVAEVTRAQFAAVMGKSSLPEIPSIAQSIGAGETHRDSLPVTDVSWFDCREFCERLSARAEERHAGRTYRLPTEAEWESACRAGSKHPFPWKMARSDHDNSGTAAGMLPPLPLRPVGAYPANDWGLYDMRGNAWEWTADWFDRDYYARSPEVDPQGPAGGDCKVVRGSDWRFVGERCRIDYATMPPWKSNPAVGFRVICVPGHPGLPSEK